MNIGKMKIADLRSVMSLDLGFPENGRADYRWDISTAGDDEKRLLQAEVVEEEFDFLCKITLDEYIKGTRVGRTLDFEVRYTPGVEQMQVFCDSEDNSPDDLLAMIQAALFVPEAVTAN